MVYEILDAQGNVVNAIVADVQFMAAQYPAGSYRLRPEPEPVPEVPHV